MEKIVTQGLLYDYYGELLTEHQKKVYEDVVYQNLSLNEIAEEEGISKQGVHDLLKRCDKILSDYEKKLHLVEKGKKGREILQALKDISAKNDDNRADEYISELENLL